MSNKKSQVVLVGVLGAVFGGVVYMQRETYFGPSSSGVADAPAVVASGSPVAAPAEVVEDPELKGAGPPINLEHIISISPFKQSNQLRRLYDAPLAASFAADVAVDGSRFVSQTAADPATAEAPPAARPHPEPKVEAVFTDRSGQWHAIVDARNVAVGDLLVDLAIGEPYAEIVAIDAGGVDIRLLDEDELEEEEEAAVDPFN